MECNGISCLATCKSNAMVIPQLPHRTPLTLMWGLVGNTVRRPAESLSSLVLLLETLRFQPSPGERYSNPTHVADHCAYGSVTTSGDWKGYIWPLFCNNGGVEDCHHVFSLVDSVRQHIHNISGQHISCWCWAALLYSTLIIRMLGALSARGRSLFKFEEWVVAREYIKVCLCMWGNCTKLLRLPHFISLHYASISCVRLMPYCQLLYKVSPALYRHSFLFLPWQYSQSGPGKTKSLPWNTNGWESLIIHK